MKYVGILLLSLIVIITSTTQASAGDRDAKPTAEPSEGSGGAECF